ncbi:MAG: bacillithiol biosynthesis cysteine-adding enzyme BshC [Candidatus Zixiibacteriota bacterium]
MSNIIAPSKTLGYTSIFLDFLTGSGPARSFFHASGPQEVAAGLDGLDYDRSALVDILVAQNQLYRASGKTFENINKLRKDDAVCVFAGQQAGLFGGPLLVMYKALAVVKAAAEYERQLGRPVVPMFWIAGDDHDFEEVNHTFVINRASEVARISYDTPPDVAVSVSKVVFVDENALAKAKDSLKQSLGETDFTGELYDLIDRSYTGSETFVSAFGKMMAELTADFGLVFFSPGDKRAKQRAARLFKAIVENEKEIGALFSATNEQLRGYGYHLQVQKDETATHLFYEHDGRKAIHRSSDGYMVGEMKMTREQLISEIDAHSERFSPDVMTRPVLQSYLFPVVSQKGGGAEIAYLAQINGIFEIFDLTAPYYRARPSITVIEKRFEKMMKEHGIGFEELAGDIEQVINRVLARSFPDDIESRFDEFRGRLGEHFQQFVDEALQFDPALRKVAEQTMGKIDYNVKAFEAKVFSSHKKKSQETRERIYRLHDALRPGRNFQERAVNISYFLSKYGRGFVDFIYDRMESEEMAHQLVYLSEMQD